MRLRKSDVEIEDRKEHLDDREAYLAERYEAATEKVGGMENFHINRITCFMLGAEWEQDRQKHSQPVNASAGPHKITVGDLSAAMIGNAVIRVTHEGGTVEGVLLDIEIDTDHANIPRGDQEYRAKVTHLSVGLRIGSFTIDGLPPGHPVELIR